MEITKNEQAKSRRYSFSAMALMIGIPALIYLFAAVRSIEMREAIAQNESANLADLATGGGLVMVRLGSIVVGILSAFIAVFGSPKESAPQWMVRK